MQHACSDAFGDIASEEVDARTVARSKMSGRFESVVGPGWQGSLRPGSAADDQKSQLLLQSKVRLQLSDQLAGMN